MINLSKYGGRGFDVAGANTGACSLRGTCPKCGGDIVLTVHEGAVKHIHKILENG